jgi:hypothetical protein
MSFDIPFIVVLQWTSLSQKDRCGTACDNPNPNPTACRDYEIDNIDNIDTREDMRAVVARRYT